MKMVTGDLADRLKIEIGYKPDNAKICKNCEHFIMAPACDNRMQCGIIDIIGYFDVWEEATCNKFSKRS